MRGGGRATGGPAVCVSVLIAFLLAFCQVPGLTVADTKYDLAQNPFGFLQRASHLWTSQASMGQVQNQAYGYFFPHGAFFLGGHIMGLPPWVIQRVWWALLLLAGFWGIVRVAEGISAGTRGSRIVAGIAFALCPRVITTLGSISSETLPMMLAPWVMLAPIRLGRGEVSARACARSAVAVALMGAVNAVATAAAVLPALLWLLAYRPNRTWFRFAALWFPLLALATLWWVVPLLLLGKVSPPFLDYIESSGVTTEWASLGEVLRGTDSWSTFVSPERIAGAVLVTQPAAVLATGLIAAAGMAGLAMRSMPARGRLALILCVGLLGICIGYAGEVGSPLAETVRTFLDSGGAPLRNVHKLEPLIRIPLALGLAQLLGRVPLPASVPMTQWRNSFAHPERDRMVAVAGLVLVAVALATSMAWTGKLAPRGAYTEVPQYWRQTAQWLSANAADTRALLVPGSPFGSQVWGLTRDEPLQALASTPWAVRDAVPLTPPGAIRAMDSVQRLLTDGRGSTGLAATLAGQGIGVVVLRNDLDPQTSRSTRPMVVHNAIANSPGLTEVARFGPPIHAWTLDNIVTDDDLEPDYPAVEIFRVQAAPPGAPAQVVSGPGAPSAPGAYLTSLATTPIIAGGPEVLERLQRTDRLPPALLVADAQRASIPIRSVVVTDTPTDRETDFGQVDNHSSAIRTADDPRRTRNLAPDYPVPGAALVRGNWSGATISASSSASDATQLGGSTPGSGSAAALDGRGWVSGGLDSAVGQWLQLNLDHPIVSGLLQVTVGQTAIGPQVNWIEIETPQGSTAAHVASTGAPVTVSLPPGHTPWVRITAIGTENGTAGNQFAIGNLTLTDFSTGKAVPVPIVHRIVVPAAPTGAIVGAWDLGQELPGSRACFDGPDRIHCGKTLAKAPEEAGTFTRTLTLNDPATVRPTLTVRTQPGPALDALLADPNDPVAHGLADVTDPRGAALAATDGDPNTAWIAPEDTVHRPAGGTPTLTIDLPAPTEVSGLVVTPSSGPLPAHPTSVAVDLGDGPQVRNIPRDGRLTLHPYVTDHITVSLQAWTAVLDHTILGFAQLEPPGLADIAVLGPDGTRIGLPTDPHRMITVDCSDGPVLTVDGRKVRTNITATATQLRNGDPVTATPCDSSDIALAPGRRDVAVTSNLFITDRLRLVNTAAPQPQPLTGHILVLPLSTNVGWSAHRDGHMLKPIVVNGWQQGWLLPDDNPVAPVTISFPADRWYRWGIFGGLLLLLPLFGLAVRRTRDTPRPPPRPYRSRAIGAVGTAVVASVIGGWAGLAIMATVVLVLTVMHRRTHPAPWRGWLAGTAGVATTVAMAALSTGPWRSAVDYLGGSAWVQVPALVAVICVALAGLPAGKALPPTHNSPPQSAS